MNREDILAIDVDELSLLVAENIFKAKVIDNEKYPEERLLIGWFEVEAWKPLNGQRWQNATWRNSEEKAWLDCPRYAEDISAAWEVEEQIKQIGGLMIGYYMTELTLIVGNKGFDMVHATPEQRCKAALLAVLDLPDKEEET